MLIALLKVVLWVVFFVSALLLIVVILLQEPKGGGLAEAFGGMGAQTFGVKSGGINKFTFAVFGVFIFSAVMLHALRHAGSAPPPAPPANRAPANPGGGGGGR